MISGENALPIFAVMLTLAAFGFWVEKKPIGRKFSGALIIIVLGMLLSNFQIIPHQSPVYSVVSSYFVPLAIPLLLFRANLKIVFMGILPLLKAFLASVFVISLSIILLNLLFNFGEYRAEVAGVVTASYIGGSLNFVAAAEAIGFKDPTNYAAALVADAIGAILFLMLLMLLPAFTIYRKAMPSKYLDFRADSVHEKESQEAVEESQNFGIIGLAMALATSMIICALSDFICKILGLENMFILMVTLMTLFVANFCSRLVTSFNSEFPVGTYLMYIFFVVIGVGTDLQAVVGVSFFYVLMVCGSVILFFFTMLFVGRLLKLDLAELMVAANACILGPATAAAMAAGRNWNDMVTPGMLAGVLGYSIATFCGAAVTQILKLIV